MSSPPPPADPPRAEPQPVDSEWPSELGCYSVDRPVTARAARGRDLAGRPVWLHWSACDGDEDDPCGAEREYGALSVNPARAVPQALDLVREPGRCWSVTEVIAGVSLAQVIAEGRDVDVGRVAACLLAALRRAHAAGWVHGDVKPANVMLRPDGSAVLVDWELATRVGRPAAPGSLGYAPPQAWEGGHRAATRSDTYSLAVLLAEMLAGERLFTGARAAVMAAQRAFRFETVESTDDVVQSVFAAADAGTGAEAASVPFGAALLDMRAEQVLQLTVRSAASGIVAAVGRGAPALAETVAFDDQRAVLAEAVAQRWRTSLRENALTLDAALLRLASVPVTGGGGRVGAERAHLRALGRELARRLAPLGPGAVIVAADAAAGDLALLTGDLVRAGETVGGRAWRVVRVDAVDAGAVSRGAARGAVRDALQVVLATSHVSGALCEAVVRAQVRRLAPALGAVCEVARAGGLGGSAGHVEFASDGGDSQRRWIDDLDRRLRTPGEADRVSDANQRDEEGAVAGAERLLLRGDALGAYRQLVRATTVLAAAGEPSQEDVARVADVWFEYGSIDASAAVLDLVDASRRTIAVWRRVGRIAATSVDGEALRSVVAGMRALGCAESDLELSRFRAVALYAAADFARAHAVLRAARRTMRAAVDVRAQIDAILSWSAVARKRGRNESAVRLLRLARSLADECGAVRAALTIDANLLVHESSDAGGTSQADAWADLAARCSRWGLHAPARRHWIRAAIVYLQADEVERAEGALSAAAEAACSGGSASTVWQSLAAYVDLQIRARRDQPLPPARRPATDDAPAASWWRWLAVALDEASLAEQADLLASPLPLGERGRGVRLSRVLLRWVARRGDASSRLVRVLRFVKREFGRQAPALGALARYAARGAADDWPLQGLLAVLRDALDEDEDLRDAALAFHAAAFVWGGVADSAAAGWLRSHAPDIDAARPFGVLAWEWRLAMLRADTTLGHEPDVDARLEQVLEALEAWSAGLPPALRARRLAVVPFDVIAGTAGLAAPEHLRIPDGGAPLVAFRAHMRCEAVKFRGSRGRAAGLERVLHSALRLRAGCTVDEVLRETVSGVLAVCRAERAVVVFDDACGERRAKLATLERMEDVGAAHAEVSESAIEHARREGRACIFDDACGNAEFGDSPSVRLYRPRSLMIAPLQAHGETLGYLYVENRSLPKSFSQSDLQLLEGFAAQAGLALDNARLVEELRSSLDELKRVRTEAVRAESLRVLGQMAGEVAHDFNNLLAVILGETQLLIQDRPDAGVERSLEVIERAAMDGAAAIRRIQSSTRARPREEFNVLDLGELVREVLDFTRVRWASGGSDPARAIRTRCRSARGVYVSGLAPELREVFTNLVLNAVDAMPDGGDLLVAVRADGDVAEVQVRDTGAGIPEAIVDRVFDPFFSTKGEGGNGLGLAIAREIVERHGGAIAVVSRPRGPARDPRGAGDELVAMRRAESPPRPGGPSAAPVRLGDTLGVESPERHDIRPTRTRPASTGVSGRTPTAPAAPDTGQNKGTVITVTLPAAERPTARPDVAEPPRATRRVADTDERRSVLVVDDEEGVLRVLSTMLRAEGFTVTSAASGAEATRRVAAGERFDVVITDLYMPGTSGVEVIAATRRAEAARRVVVMSGYGDVVGEGRISRESVDGVLAKPFTLADVREAVGEAS